MSSRTVGKASGSAEERVRHWALIGGIGVLLIAAFSVFANFIVFEALVTPGDATATAADIASSKGLFQAGIVGWFVIAALDVVVAVALFRVLRPVSERLSALAAWSRTLYGVVLGAATFQLVGALSLLDGITAASSGEVLQKAEAFTDMWNAGLVLFGIHLMLVGYLALRSGYMPKIVGSVVAIAGFGYLFDAAVRVAVADPSLSLSVITGLGEFVLGVWLVARSRRIALPVSARGTSAAGAGKEQPAAALSPQAGGSHQTWKEGVSMKAIVHDAYGTADGLELREIDRPEIGDAEVLIKVHAAGVDRGVWHVMTGLPYPIRVAGYGLRAPKNPVLGSDVAGVVETVGKAVTEFKPGDEVFGVAKGSYAEYAVVTEDKLAPKPANLTFEQAAVVPTSASTALQALRKSGVQAGQKVLITGASGGVGTFAVQLAKALGAEVTAVCSTPKVDLVRSIGADHVVDYKTSDFAVGGDRFDVIIDIGGNATLARLRSVLTPKGTLVITGGETDGRWLGGADRQMRAQVLSLVVGQRLGTFIASVTADDLSALKEKIENGELIPVVDRTYPLSEVPEAIVYLDEGQARGKVAISV